MVRYLPSEASVTVQVVYLEIATNLTASAPSQVVQGEEFTISGQLTRADTGEGLGGMTIELYVGTTLLATTTTDSGGYYTFRVVENRVGTFTYTVKFPGYETATLAYSPATATVGGMVTPAPLLPITLPIAIFLGVMSGVVLGQCFKVLKLPKF